MKRLVFVGLVALLVVGQVGCSSWSKTEKGAAIGAAAGGVIGGVIGDKAGNTAVGAILGAAVGGTAGAYIGKYMDEQAAEMQKDVEGAKVERVGEGIKLTFDSGLLFDVDKATLRQASRDQLAKMALVLEKYPDTNILIEGHADATGTEEHNLVLSQQRAQSVGDYLAYLGVDSARLTMKGYGESQPIASNDTEEGRQQNRRVEVAIFANDQLKETAREQSQG